MQQVRLRTLKRVQQVRLRTLKRGLVYRLAPGNRPNNFTDDLLRMNCVFFIVETQSVLVKRCIFNRDPETKCGPSQFTLSSTVFEESAEEIASNVMWCCEVVVVLLLVIVAYKVLDRLVRLANVGRCQDRCVLVTGCANGFGFEAVKRLDGLGCHVFAGCRREESVGKLKEIFSDRVDPFRLDIADRESVREAFRYVSSKLPKDTGLWGLVNNAGIYRVLPFEFLTAQSYEDTLKCNLYGTIDVTMTFLPLVKKARGRIVNVSSDSGRNTLPLWVPYCVSKYGLEAFTDGLRRSIRRYDCMVALVEPGGYKTNIFNEESLVKDFDSSWERVSPDVRQDLGTEFKNRAKEKLLKMIRDYPVSENVGEVIDAYEHALFGLFPRARYLVGRDAKILVLLQALPECISDAILTKFALPDLYS